MNHMKERIAECYDPDVLVDLLNITSEELLERFMDKVLENIEEFETVLEE